MPQRSIWSPKYRLDTWCDSPNSCMTLAQESGPASVHQHTFALASKSGKNDVRDFWRSADIPVASSQPKELFICLFYTCLLFCLVYSKFGAQKDWELAAVGVHFFPCSHYINHYISHYISHYINHEMNHYIYHYMNHCINHYMNHISHCIRHYMNHYINHYMNHDNNHDINH